MPTPTPRRDVLCGAAALALLRPAAALASAFVYKDWRADTSELSGPLSPEVEASMRQQFDIVESLNGRIRPDAYAFFRSLPITFIPQSRGGAGDYVFGSRRLNLTAKAEPPENPVLLHEMLHAWHDQKLGRMNPKLRELYFRTAASHAFPPRPTC